MGLGRTEGLLLALYLSALLLVGLLTVGSQGITWDEPNYFGSSYSYLSWFAHVAAEPADWWASIDRFWAPSHEAPPFFKLWAGLFAGAGALVLGTEDLGALGDAYRMGSYALFLLATYAAFRFARGEFGVVAAWGAALGMPLIPALFGFARLGQLDGAVASMFLLSAIATYRMLSRGGRGRVVLSGVLLGLAFATKINVFPLVLASLLWVLIYGRGENLKTSVSRLAAGFGIGALTFFAIWPWLWRDPAGRLWGYLTWAGGLQDERFTYYLGEWWAGAPFHYPLVALLAYAPLVVAAAGVLGVCRMLGAASSPASGWILLHLALVLAVAGSGLVPVYGGPRQFLAAFPLWAICAGVGLAWASSRLRLLRRPAVPLALYCALALPGIVWTGPGNSLEYYGEAVGLIPGARALGFETTYLADTYGPAVDYLNEEAERGATVYAQAGTFAVLEAYRRTGELREDLRPAYLAPIAPDRYTVDDAPRPGSFFLFLPRQSIYTNGMLALEDEPPLYAHEKGGVPLVKVYSGEAVGETLAIEGVPEPREVGLGNALISLGLVLLLLLVLLRAQKKQGEERE
ncbi:hypothetical protein GBA65_13920 [Rubrobacter marinus]|uniref:Glycosyltransferase RgtA/B/C/D-like domain-containing protein n=1 Tax=Rubrobacter marinus TaxID=2653852 RepID=A0A6G8PZ71_9ACTN|nr:glycosyltransferase family 39 protein [Rubrobacter marinus]QIN79427.1 hypothetical protein GBA65_13920 [Rubrobacter marinus]